VHGGNIGFEKSTRARATLNEKTSAIGSQVNIIVSGSYHQVLSTSNANQHFDGVMSIRFISKEHKTHYQHFEKTY
jgi:hypothetical protein